MHFEQNGCFADWDGARLTCGNALFTATFRLNHSVEITELRAAGRVWTDAAERDAADAAAPAEAQCEAAFGAGSAVESPSLRITLNDPESHVEWKIWPDLAGFWMQTEGEAPQYGTPVNHGKAPTGIELGEVADAVSDMGFALPEDHRYLEAGCPGRTHYRHPTFAL